MLKVYVAGKLNANNAVDYIKNVHEMMHQAEEVRRHGYSVFVPALDLMMGIMFGDYEYKDYFDNNMVWLEAADVVFVCRDSQSSSGTQREVARAVELGIPVVHTLVQLKGVANVKDARDLHDSQVHN